MESSPELLNPKTSGNYDHLDMTGEQDSVQKYSDLDVSLKFVQSLLSKKVPQEQESVEVKDQVMSDQPVS